jgi:hypothetical protein
VTFGSLSVDSLVDTEGVTRSHRRIPRQRRRRILLVVALVLAIGAVAMGLSTTGAPARLDWTTTERAGWVAGIIGALLSCLSTVAAFLALRSQRASTPPGGEKVAVIQVGAVPQAAAWAQHRRTQIDLVRTATTGRAIPLTQVLSGLGGVGKTQLAANLSRELVNRGDIDVLVWVTASSREAVVSAYSEAARAVSLATPDTPPEVAATRLLGWLEHTRRRWMVVLDNLDTPGDASGWWPPATRTGRTVVTTRRRDASLQSDRRRLIQVDTFTADEAVSYLARATGTTSGEPAEVAALAADLGNLPLALAQAAAFIRDRGIGCAAYRQRLNDHKRPLRDVLPSDDALPDAHRTTVAATWALSLEAADQLPPRGVARALIRLAALLDPHGVPAGLFTAEASIRYVANSTGQDVDAETIADGLRNLHRLSLVTLDRESGHVRIHALVQRTTRDASNAEQTRAAADAAGHALVAIWPDTTHDPGFNQMLRANAIALQQHAGDLLILDEIHPVLFRLGRHLLAVGSVAAAIGHFSRLLDSVSAHLGPKHPDRLSIDAEIAELKGYAGDRTGVVSALAAVLTARAEVLGGEHRLTLQTRHALAHWSGHAGDYGYAISGLTAVLNDQSRTLGPDHQDTLITRGNLAHWRGEAGDFAGAADDMERVYADRLRALGADHPRTLIARLSLAFWRTKADGRPGRFDELEQLLADHVQALGPDHPAVLMNRSHLANSRGEAGDHAGARAAFEALLADRLRVLGPEHPQTLTTRVNLAHWRGEVEGPARALPDLEAVLADQTRVLESSHPDIMRTLASAAHWRARSGDVAGAVEAFTSILERQTSQLGDSHADARATQQALDHWLGVLTARPGTVSAVPPLGRRRRISE